MGNLTYNIKPHDWHTVQVAIQNLANKLGPTASPTMLSITISSTATVSAIVATTAKISSAAIDSAAFIGLTANSATLTSLAFQSALGSTMVAGVISVETLNATVGTITAFSCQSATISSLVGTVVSADTFTASTGTITSLACQSASISALTITSAIISSTILSSAHITNLSCLSATISSLVVNSAVISAFTVGSCYQEPCVVNIGGEPSTVWPYAQVYIAGNSNAANKGASFTYHSKFQPVNSETPAWYFGAGEGGVVQNDNFRISALVSAHNDIINLNPFAADRSFCIDSVGMVSIGQATISSFACVSANISVGVFATISVTTFTDSTGTITSFSCQSAVISTLKSSTISVATFTASSAKATSFSATSAVINDAVISALFISNNNAYISGDAATTFFIASASGQAVLRLQPSVSQIANVYTTTAKDFYIQSLHTLSNIFFKTSNLNRIIIQPAGTVIVYNQLTCNSAVMIPSATISAMTASSATISVAIIPTLSSGTFTASTGTITTLASVSATISTMTVSSAFTCATAVISSFTVSSVCRANVGFNFNGTAGISANMTLANGTVLAFLGGILISVTEP